MEILESLTIEGVSIFTGYSMIGTCASFAWVPSATLQSNASGSSFVMKGLECMYDVEALLIRKDLFLRTADSRDFLLTNFQITDIEDSENVAGTADSLEILSGSFPEIKNFIQDEEVVIDKRNHIEAFEVMSGVISNIQNGLEINASAARNIAEKFVYDITRHPDAVTNLLDIKSFDDYTFTHNINVSTLAVIIGQELGLNEESLLNLALGAMMHDIGKLKIPLEIINKDGKLTDSEFNLIKSHSNLGYEILSMSQNFPEIVKQISLQHHEKHGGHGYPHNLKGDEISLFSRITAIADVYDALTTDRPYRNAMPPYTAIKSILSQVETHFNPTVLKAFIRRFSLFPSGSLVHLNNNSVALVIKSNSKSVLRPTVKVLKSSDGHILKKREVVNLMNEKDLYILGPASVESLSKSSLKRQFLS
ncbi:MAG: HD-GYP domain-containing protein [Candidatus Riflebacteria bacterium]|nr:HD-GYP domain-containing protein [Candidatus Riflebacteria bacterium]